MVYDADESDVRGLRCRFRRARSRSRTLRVVLHARRRAVRRLGVLGSQRLSGVHRGGHPRRAACSRAPRSGRPQSSSRSGGTSGSSSTPATTSPVTRSTTSAKALEVNSDLIAFAQMTFAYSTETVNGVPGKRVPGPRWCYRHRRVPRARSRTRLHSANCMTARAGRVRPALALHLLRMVGISRMFRDHRPLPRLRARRRPDRRRPEAASSAGRPASRADRRAPA